MTSTFYDKQTGVTALLAQIREHEEREDAQANAREEHGVPFKYKDWMIVAHKSHITPLQALEDLGNSVGLTPPEMVFGKNQLLVMHKPSGFCLSFIAAEALACCHFKAGDDKEQLQVSMARDQPSTKGDDVKKLAISYDWTYTSDYKGTLARVNGDGVANVEKNTVHVEATQERIDYEKLKVREEILWMDEVNLYEDELHDHGVSVFSIRMRVMPSGFYVLARYWMRLDNVVVRLNETRIHHLFGQDHFLREFTAKETTFEQLFAQGQPTHMSHYTNIDTFQHLLATKYSAYDKVFLH
ncbi:unnamed protein product [Aphanomyces euteiches]|uniref:TIP41-like protein n=1 Tax=Aphanomyces euteiches TaxID=100861 RepID=A0A6G0X0R0_9STRA|nr:hypothetical protein Ae201684_009670 [Aphanomyces euteiches]KAH9086065.1 hypothetical protein Ae201684P_005760 [Aphanomyces euteiches]KAH9154911.1 hypothetical protein AeRB84_003077 [Aphanomyces euteiches]